MEVHELAEKFQEHLETSARRFEALQQQISTAAHASHMADWPKGKHMTDGINTDKVVVNAGSGGGEGGGNAAMIAALLNGRNQDSTLGPLIASMCGGRRGYGDSDGFGGMNGILGIAALGLIFGRGRGGLFGGGDEGGGGGAETRLQSNADTLALLGAIGNVKDAVSGGFATTALALSQGFANVKDSQQASTFLLSNQLNGVNQNVSEQACKTREIVQAGTTAVLQAIKDNEIAQLQAQVCRLENRGHARETEISVNQTVNQAQAQQQQQQQVSDRFRRIEQALEHVVQIAHATNSNVIAGNTGAVTTAAQTANPVNVNA